MRLLWLQEHHKSYLCPFYAILKATCFMFPPPWSGSRVKSANVNYSLSNIGKSSVSEH